MIEIFDSIDSIEKKKYESFLFVEKLILNIEKTQKSQQSNLKLNENKIANIDNNNNIYFKNDGSTFEQGRKYCFFNISRIFVVGSKAGYDL